MADHRRAGAALAAMGGAFPQGHGGVVVKKSWDDWERGNPNKAVGTTGKKVEKAPTPGVPLEEYDVIELTKEYTLEDPRANRANMKFVEFLNNIKSSRIQLWEAILESKKGGKNKKRSVLLETVHIKAGLKILMEKINDEKAAVLREGGLPIPVPTRFYKTIDA